MAAAAAIINIWLSLRIGKVRMGAKIIHGDGGNDLLMRRMRAQANFIENTPIALVLVTAIEIAGEGGAWLAPVAGIFILGRLAHGLGMDSVKPSPMRTAGALCTMLVLLGLAIVAVLITLGMI
jgi:uncharacterized membrane protein YecN with MAPEG domain